MTDADFEVLDAFADGIRVDPDALKRALADAEGRDYFVDVLALREAARHLDAIDAPRAATGARTGRAPMRFAAAAAILVMAGAAGYAAGSRAFAAERDAQGAIGTETVVDLSTPAPAPAPTRVIKLQPGVNWTDQTGGR